MHADVLDVLASPGCLVQEMRSSMGMPYHSQNQINSEVNEVLAKFDINKDGDIGFDEFLRMIVTKPWNILLPETTRDKLHETVMNTVSDAPVHKRERDVIFRAAALEAAAQSVLRASRNLFREYDSNGDGQLNRDELGHVIMGLWQHLGDPIASAAKLEAPHAVGRGVGRGGNGRWGKDYDSGRGELFSGVAADRARFGIVDKGAAIMGWPRGICLHEPSMPAICIGWNITIHIIIHQHLGSTKAYHIIPPNPGHVQLQLVLTTSSLRRSSPPWP